MEFSPIQLIAVYEAGQPSPILLFTIEIVERLLHGFLKLFLKCSRIENEKFFVESRDHVLMIAERGTFIAEK